MWNISTQTSDCLAGNVFARDLSPGSEGPPLPSWRRRSPTYRSTCFPRRKGDFLKLHVDQDPMIAPDTTRAVGASVLKGGERRASEPKGEGQTTATRLAAIPASGGRRTVGDQPRIHLFVRSTTDKQAVWSYGRARGQAQLKRRPRHPSNTA